MDRFPRVIVDLAALSNNLETIRRQAPGCPVMAVVKANAYGHGLVAAARALQDADALAVARIGEALTLREAGVSNEIVLLEGVFSSQELDLAAEHRLTLVVHNEQQLRWLEDYPRANRFVCWLKLDTGMHRLGFTRPASEDAMARIQGAASVRQPPGLMTHLASSELLDDPITASQLSVFTELGRDWPGPVSSANSAAIFLRPETRVGWLRPGLALYGVSPIKGQTGNDLGLQPAMRLQTRLISVKNVKAGDSVGYNSAWTAKSSTRIGIAAIGYGDGYLRSFGNGTPVIVAGQRVALAGRVSMDMIALDLGAQSEAGVGDEVLLWGDGLAVEELAQWAGTIPYELLCNVSARVATEYAAPPPVLA